MKGSFLQNVFFMNSQGCCYSSGWCCSPTSFVMLGGWWQHQPHYRSIVHQPACYYSLSYSLRYSLRSVVTRFARDLIWWWLNKNEFIFAAQICSSGWCCSPTSFVMLGGWWQHQPHYRSIVHQPACYYSLSYSLRYSLRSWDRFAQLFASLMISNFGG